MTNDPAMQSAASRNSTGTSSKDREPPTPVGAQFKMVFLSVLLLDLILILGTVAMSILIKQPTPMVEDAIANCRTLATTGFGAICGLIGGKAVT
jgi:hypothetical protein